MDDQDIAALRRRAQQAGLGVDWSQADDHAVVDFVAWATPSESAEGPTLQRLSPKITVAAPAPARSGASSPRQAAAASPPPAASPSTPGPQVDAVAMAQTLRVAARNGTPFCEECERLKQQRAHAAA